MMHPVPPILVKELRHLLASAISNEKSYNVPSFCARLGLESGTPEEAFSSKYKYVQKRLIALSVEQLLAVTRAYLDGEEDFALSEHLAKIDELPDSPITSLTRRKLIALFEGKSLATELSDIEVLRTAWPIDKITAPIQGAGFTLEDDIYRHTIRNDDLTQKELLQYVGILTCSRRQVGRFLAAVTSPEAQTAVEQTKLVEQINQILRPDGYSLAVEGRISESPYYSLKQTPRGSPADQTISAALEAFDPTQIHLRWQNALERRAAEPEGAITLARTLLEDVCKWILHQANETWEDTDDLPALYRKLSKRLNLAPDDHTERVFKQILGSCQSIVESLGALRNRLGDAHSPGPRRARPHRRHAELAVNLAGTMATFLIATWKARESENHTP